MKEDKLLQRMTLYEVTQNMRPDELNQTHSGGRECATLAAPGCTINFDRARVFYTSGVVSMSDVIGDWHGVPKDEPFIFQTHVVQTITNVEAAGKLTRRTLAECEYSANYKRNPSSVDAPRGVNAVELCRKLKSGEMPRLEQAVLPEFRSAVQYIDKSNGIVFETSENSIAATSTQLLE